MEEAKSLAIENGNTFWLLILLKDQISRAGLIHDKGTLDGPIDELEAEFYAGIEDARRTGSFQALISRLAILNRQRYGTGLLDRVNDEDRGCTEKVYRGLCAPMAAPGHLSHLERPNYDFARYLYDRVRS